jgi:acetyl esterase/lipase
MAVEMNVPYGKGRDPRQRMDWFMPDRANGASILFVHGGGWQGGDRKQWHGVAAHFAGLGFTCASAGYRLMPDADLRDQLADVRLAMSRLRERAVKEELRADRIAAVGSSAGGHLVAMLGTVAPDDPLGLSEELADR